MSTSQAATSAALAREAVAALTDAMTADRSRRTGPRELSVRVTWRYG